VATLSKPPDPNPHKPRLVCPPGAWDCHIHLFGPKSEYPLLPNAIYDTADALPETYFALQAVLGLQRTVIVQTMVHGPDHRRLLDTLRQYPQRCRGIAAPAADISDQELDEMNRLGVRGIRVVVSTGLPGVQAPVRPNFDQRLIARIADRGWHVQIIAGAADIVALRETLRSLPTNFVIDHAGLPRVEQGVNHEHFRTLLGLLDSGRCWVKLSGPMRFSRQRALPYRDTLPFYRALVKQAPDRLLWGSDWPHIHYNEGEMPNDGDLLDLLWEWAPAAADRQRILVENPQVLYGS
jgi:2-pyrone-4,6-dicarboxylate lactonase